MNAKTTLRSALLIAVSIATSSGSIAGARQDLAAVRKPGLQWQQSSSGKERQKNPSSNY